MAGLRRRQKTLVRQRQLAYGGQLVAYVSVYLFFALRICLSLMLALVYSGHFSFAKTKVLD